MFGINHFRLTSFIGKNCISLFAISIYYLSLKSNSIYSVKAENQTPPVMLVIPLSYSALPRPHFYKFRAHNPVFVRSYPLARKQKHRPFGRCFALFVSRRWKRYRFRTRQALPNTCLFQVYHTALARFIHGINCPSAMFFYQQLISYIPGIPPYFVI